MEKHQIKVHLTHYKVALVEGGKTGNGGWGPNGRAGFNGNNCLSFWYWKNPQ